VLEVGGHGLAVAAWCVAEIVDALAVSPLPEAPPDVDGVAALRGRALPVLDLRRRLGVPAAGSGVVLLVRDRAEGDLSFGLRVDRVREIRQVPLDAIAAPPPPDAIGTAHRFLLGMLGSGTDTLLVLDLPEILASDEKLLLDELVARLEDAPPGA
jgi:purine-binding chemotaxis protein CheW